MASTIFNVVAEEALHVPTIISVAVGSRETTLQKINGFVKKNLGEGRVANNIDYIEIQRE